MRMSFSPSPSWCLSSPECGVPGWERPGPKRGDSNNLARSRDQSVSPQSSPSLQGSSKPRSSKRSVSEQFKYGSTQGFFRWRWRLLHHGALVLSTTACPPLSHSSLWMHLSLISEGNTSWSIGTWISGKFHTLSTTRPERYFQQILSSYQRPIRPRQVELLELIDTCRYCTLERLPLK